MGGFLLRRIYVKMISCIKTDTERIRNKMKKKMVLSLVFGAILLALTACGKKEETKEVEKKKVIEDYNVDEYVTKLGNYKGLEYKLEENEPTEEEIKAEVDAFLAAYPDTITDRPVQEGDTVNIDFVGKKDGVAFDGGTAKGYDLTIGSHKFIPGFEEGLVGLKIGETKDLSLKFPEDYHSEELKGAAVVFTVTINSISSAKTELTDELVAANSDFKTVSEFTDNIKKELKVNKEESAKRVRQTDLLEKVIADSEIKPIPETLKAAYIKEYVGYYERQAKANKMEFQDYLKKAWNMTEEDMKKAAENMANNLGRQKLVMEAIAKKEAMTVSEEEYKAELEAYYNASSLSQSMDIEAFEKQTGKQMIEDIVTAKKVLQLLEKEAKAVN